MNTLSNRIILSVISALALFVSSATAQEAKPSDESLRKLFEVSKVSSLLDQIWGQMESMMNSNSERALAGQPATPEQLQAIDKMQKGMMEIMQDELKWENLEPIYLDVYRNTFTQTEVDAMVGFYETPAGQSMINKMPQVMQQTMVQMQGRMGPIMERMEKVQGQFMHEIEGHADDHVH